LNFKLRNKKEQNTPRGKGCHAFCSSSLTSHGSSFVFVASFFQMKNISNEKKKDVNCRCMKLSTTYIPDNIFYSQNVAPAIFGEDGECCAGEYRFGFGGQERDNEIYGFGNSYTAEYWQYDSRLGRRWNVDPVTYPWQSPYSAFNNNPIVFNDPRGLEGNPTNDQSNTKPDPDGITQDMLNDPIDVLGTGLYEGWKYDEVFSEITKEVVLTHVSGDSSLIIRNNRRVKDSILYIIDKGQKANGKLIRVRVSLKE
jgi:RHS repeat-associated protein